MEEEWEAFDGTTASLVKLYRENQIRVEQLAEWLFSDGVHCVIDIYDLQDGQDKNIFMEKMKVDKELTATIFDLTGTNRCINL